MKSLIPDILGVTEAAAMASYPYIGKRDKIAADSAATNAMRLKLNQMNMSGTVVIGEGEIDEAPMLYIGEELGTEYGPSVDIAVDPIEGTTPVANNQDNAITVIAVAPKGTLLHAPDMYMKKIAVNSNAKGTIDIDDPLEDNLRAVAKANNKRIEELTVAIQDRPRHRKYVNIINKAGANVHLFRDGDVIYATATCMNNPDIDMFFGIGGAPEGVLASVAVKCLGGEMQAKLLPQNDIEHNRCLEMGLSNPETVLRHNQLVGTDECIFAATGVTDSLLINGMKSADGKYRTHSILLNGMEKRLSFIESNHPSVMTV
ncbi:class II fructose-bisphosphatase [Virgibacillus siamensis]|uniref:class II fructose-bisphosphatase n=1 Tax=Virgibacillus siamensis TaxID=480071 RepID=UPI0011155FD9|nr:class II fructose-bisphosphatase [Virgibacillus siamensis]